jgi:hypothetical protein
MREGAREQGSKCEKSALCTSSRILFALAATEKSHRQENMSSQERSVTGCMLCGCRESSVEATHKDHHHPTSNFQLPTGRKTGAYDFVTLVPTSCCLMLKEWMGT